MSAQITVTVAGSERSVAEQTTAGELLEGDRSVVVARVNGQLRDLFHVVAEGDVVEQVTVDSEDGLAVLRHSTAHVLAQAVQQLHADAKLGIGPPVRDGFYYDFDVETPFTPEDLRALEKVMQRIVNEGQTFVRREVSDAEGVTPMTHAVPIENVMRPDVVTASLDRDEVLAGAPAAEDGRFRVPRILDDEQ